MLTNCGIKSETQEKYISKKEQTDSDQHELEYTDIPSSKRNKHYEL